MRKVFIDRTNCFRAILTDTLPYETPLFFTNEPLYLQASKSPQFQGFPDLVTKLLVQKTHTKPFVYRVQKSGGSHRKLAIPHPAAQLRFAELYRDFDSFIENICSRSSYSLRYPTRVGSHFFQSQFATEQKGDGQIDADPASFTSQRKWASSYFYYKQYSHIHKFFSSQEFVRLEQKFSLMLKIDIARCFESIYTHSIAWAVRGKDFSKDNKAGFFFESEFDMRMQEANWGETNGILIGPEVSRIFAEAIMQSIDIAVQRKLGKLAETTSIRRYVDDFFVFGNNEGDLLHIKGMIEEAASQFNLHINEKKTELIPRPLISGFSVARQRVAATLKDVLRSARSALDGSPQEFSRFAADKTIAEIRRIGKEHNVDYSTLASPALAIIDRGINLLRRRLGSHLSPDSRTRGEAVVYAVLRISTFLFLMDIRSATSHKLAKIFFNSSLLFDRIGAGRLAFEGAVSDSVRLALEKARLQKITGPEIVNILVAADAVCRKMRGVPEGYLRSALGVTIDWKTCADELNYFELVTTLYFARTKYSFREAREAAVDSIENRVRSLGPKLVSHAEETMLFFDFISCPYIDEAKREALFFAVATTLGSAATPATLSLQFRHVSKSLTFVAWEGASHFQAMLERRELQSAYDS